MFSFSDQDEWHRGEITLADASFPIYNVTDGSDEAKKAFAVAVLASAAGKANVIVLGDHNLRDYEEGYQMLDAVFTNAWTSVYPTKISPDGVDMSGRNRIDHIFVSPDLKVRNPVYVLPPESYTDHPVHWAEIYWEK
jgi:endonuclease/exonuclease/phosphatase family metal-dependent hydrolase